MALRAACLAVVLLVAACAADPLPELFAGPRASQTDLVMPTERNSTDIFYAAASNGKAIRNSRVATASASFGPIIRASTVQRELPAERMILTLTGVRHYTAPVIGMFSPSYRITGDVEFVP